MRLLLDTHALIWWFGDTDLLGTVARLAIGEADEVWVSSASVYEMSLKHHLGKLPGVAHLLPGLSDHLIQQGFQTLPLTISHADLAGRLSRNHRDPFDRMLAAQALTEDLTIVSGDEAFDQFGVRRLW